ncbi:dTDP-4-dehydrorhamnose reductase [Rhodohalobacter sp. 8-1]|uniref:dTDP-4-dehydrorhamnose reductase n=1 Tax=Rhodohalobacter sp. 8-1 TaxID=3131972 RepID=UPI0030EB81E6
MKILITGASGQLGREWVRYLEDSDHEVSACDSTALDITDREAVHSVLQTEEPDMLINCAAYTDVDGAEDNPEMAYSVNEIGVQNLAHACNRHQVLLIHYSTDYVFAGSVEDKKKLPDGYDEEFPPSPNNVYGKSKRGGEIAIEKFADRWMIIRVSWLCGQFGENFIKTMLRLSQEKDRLQIVDDQTGSPSYCFDVVEKTMKLVELDQTGIFHVSSKGAITWYNLTQEIIRLSGSNTALEAVTSADYPMKAERPAYSLLNTQKIENLGLEPISWKDGLKRLMNQLNELNHDH